MSPIVSQAPTRLHKKVGRRTIKQRHEMKLAARTSRNALSDTRQFIAIRTLVATDTSQSGPFIARPRAGRTHSGHATTWLTNLNAPWAMPCALMTSADTDGRKANGLISADLINYRPIWTSSCNVCATGSTIYPCFLMGHSVAGTVVAAIAYRPM